MNPTNDEQTLDTIRTLLIQASETTKTLQDPADRQFLNCWIDTAIFTTELAGTDLLLRTPAEGA
jgi:hypothetical protein